MSVEIKSTNNHKELPPLLQPNEILTPDIPNNTKHNENGASQTRMSILWKVKHESVVRSGELLAVYSASPTAHSLPIDSLGSKAVASGDPTTTAQQQQDVVRKSEIIRPRKRNRLAMKKSASASVVPGDKGEKQDSISSSRSVEDGADKVESLSLPKKESGENGGITQAVDLTATDESTPIAIRADIDGIITIYNKPQKRRRVSSASSPHDSDAVTVDVCGVINKCTHPMVIDNLCAVCGKSTKPEPSPNGGCIPTTNKRDSLTVPGGVTIKISSDYGESFSSNSSRELHKVRKMNLVLDLDHTLLHATNDARAASWVGKCKDIHTILLPAVQQQPQSARYPGFTAHYIKVRPHVARFLDNLLDRFEISIYTAATGVYAHKVADMLCRHVIDYRTRLRMDKNSKNGDMEKGGEETDSFCLDEEDLLVLRQQVFELNKHVEYITRLNEKLKGSNTSNEKQQGKQSKDHGDSTSVETNDKKEDRISDRPGGESSDKSPKNKKRRVTFSTDVDVSDSPRPSGSGTPSANLARLQSAYLKQLQEKLKRAEARETEALKLRKKIFANRIVSRTDVTDLGCDVKSLKRVFPCGGMLAAIVDDREDVWANANNNVTGRKGEPPDNLLLVRPYRWRPFINYADVNNSAGVDISTQAKSSETQDAHDPTIEKEEEQLMWTYDILTRLHDRYYSDKIPESERNKLTAPSILKDMRKNILGASGRQAKIVFSGLVPLHVQHTIGKNNKPRPAIVRYAEELGAEVMSKISNEVTHVVAARDGTDKIKQAREIPGCAVVTAKWLIECFWSISLKDINNYLIGPPPIKVVPSKPTKLLLSGSDSSEEEDGESSEEEDDAFFAGFDKEGDS